MARFAWARAVVGAMCLCVFESAASAAPFTRDAVVTRIIDGDTFEVAGGAKIRVRNFDTPELRSYECQEEKALAQAARDKARDILMGERVRLRVSDEDRYRRLVADVAVLRGGRSVDFVETMTEAGHGARWNYGHEPQPDWCDAEARIAGRAEADRREREALMLDVARWALRELF